MGRFFRVSIGYTLLGHHNSPAVQEILNLVGGEAIGQPGVY